MRISDWSSDVCSSDLEGAIERSDERLLRHPARGSGRRIAPAVEHRLQDLDGSGGFRLQAFEGEGDSLHLPQPTVRGKQARQQGRAGIHHPVSVQAVRWVRSDPLPARSEEHTSELQSLICISYSVYCLKKKIR